MKAVIVSYSELDAYRQCPLKHHLAYKQRWTKTPGPGTPLARGTLWHLVMERHYSVLQRLQRELPGWSIKPSDERYALEVLRKAVRPLFSDPDTGKQSSDQELAEWMYQGYVAQWGVDPQWRILEIERAAIVPLPSDTGRPSSRYRLKVKIDLIVQDRKADRWLIDHKSCKNLPNRLELDIDDQFGLYTAALRQLGWPVTGAIHSAARTERLKGDQEGTKLMPLDTRFARTSMFRSDAELTNLLRDAARTAREAYSPGPPRSAPNPNTCKWRCDFLDAHLMMRKGIPASTVLPDMGFSVDRSRH